MRVEEVREPRRAEILLAKIPRGVEAAHQAGIIHRDLEPGNVLFDARGEPLVADFGLALPRDSEDDLTRGGQKLGTSAYVAPEQAAGGNHRVRPAADMWALGVILFEVPTGYPESRGWRSCAAWKTRLSG
jgi:serine/threonine protein kinase